MKYIKSLLVGTIISLLSINSYAQEKATSKDPFSERKELIKKYGNTNVLKMGWYTGVVDNF